MYEAGIWIASPSPSCLLVFVAIDAHNYAYRLQFTICDFYFPFWFIWIICRCCQCTVLPFFFVLCQFFFRLGISLRLLRSSTIFLMILFSLSQWMSKWMCYTCHVFHVLCMLFFCMFFFYGVLARIPFNWKLYSKRKEFLTFFFAIPFWSILSFFAFTSTRSILFFSIHTFCHCILFYSHSLSAQLKY